MSSDRRLVEQYSGSRAKDYDLTRVKSPRYQAEEATFEKLFALAQPASVLDIPVGTGRWLERYAAAGVRALGVDASADMLGEAAEKLARIEGHRIELKQGDAFDRTFFEGLGEKFDLVACVRFLNWIPGDKVATVLANLNVVSGRHVLLGVGTLPGERGSWRRMAARLTVWWINLERRRRRRWLEHVHERSLIERVTVGLGWREVERIQIFSAKGRVNAFVLYEKEQGRP